MRATFENAQERDNVAATITKLIETVNERSHSTAEVKNLRKALAVIYMTPTAYSVRDYDTTCDD